MGKPFEITYSPAAWTSPSGGIATNWSIPYGGLNVQSPPNIIGPSESPAHNNFFFRNSELRSRPAFKTFIPGPDGNTILGVGSFLSKNGVWHTFAFTINGLYQLSANVTGQLAAGRNPWTLVGGPALSPTDYVRWRVFQNILYYSNNNGHLSAWDGAALTPITDAAFLGAGVSGKPPTTTTLIGTRYIGELDNHILLASTTETLVTAGVVGATSSFQQRIRWSVNNFNPYDTNGVFGANLGTAGATFDPTIFVNAGSNDFLEVPDLITGILFIGRMGYVFRQNGVTEVSPTGQGQAPFDFNHMWASEQGIGNVYGASIAQYGSVGIFISTDNVYMLAANNVEPIGMGARDAIMRDLALTVGNPTAAIVPALTLGYNFLAYYLFIPLASGDTRCYVFSLEERNWASWTIGGNFIGVPFKCWIGDVPIAVTTQQIVTPPAGGGLPGAQGDDKLPRNKQPPG